MERIFDEVRIEIASVALERLYQAGLRLPDTLLPHALGAATGMRHLRPATLAVIGNRGSEIAAQHPGWLWATARSPADETLWKEGTFAQRVAILEVVRACNPACGREWLETAWVNETPKFRSEAIDALLVRLSPDDEPFLESALGDRSPKVRAKASKLLARLPNSAFALRMRERADTMLDVVTTGGNAGRQLLVTPPTTVNRAWRRDRLIANPSQAVGVQNWWLTTALASVPPIHWSERFNSHPADLIAAAAQNGYGPAILEGWAEAAGNHGDDEWAILLWKWWCHYHTGHLYYRHAFLVLRWALIRRLSRVQADALALETVPCDAKSDDQRWLDALEAMQSFPTPWPVEVGMRFLDGLRDRAPQGFQFGYPYDPWLKAVTLAEAAMPRECIPRFIDELAHIPLEEPGGERQLWREYREGFIEGLRIRQRLEEEIAS